MNKKAKRKLKKKFKEVTNDVPSKSNMRRLKKAYIRRTPAFAPGIRIDIKRKSRGRISIKIGSP